MCYTFYERVAVVGIPLHTFQGEHSGQKQSPSTTVSRMKNQRDKLVKDEPLLLPPARYASRRCYQDSNATLDCPEHLLIPTLVSKAQNESMRLDLQPRPSCYNAEEDFLWRCGIAPSSRTQPPRRPHDVCVCPADHSPRSSRVLFIDYESTPFFPNSSGPAEESGAR